MQGGGRNKGGGVVGGAWGAPEQGSRLLQALAGRWVPEPSVPTSSFSTPGP